MYNEVLKTTTGQNLGVISTAVNKLADTRCSL